MEYSVLCPRTGSRCAPSSPVSTATSAPPNGSPSWNLTTFDVDPYWEQRGWDGDPEGSVTIKRSSRIDAPGPF
ncbi:hypothetical protein GCM10010210_45560 [Pseudonocardia hydrocarbonoxydans]|uniref:Uncharacterized protein n=1 Tax=Pseudonocardia hydrocarbonoxydans TaxID=76726 RepID=A0A4Y3WUU0_9PSEU|nr:hypothetical protein PHY01_48760 [Pseudonocardia hydrocarbonoxydans]